MTRPMERVIALLATVVTLGACASAGGATPAASGGAAADRVVRVAAAADLKFALEEIADLVAAQHPTIRMDATLGSSGTFVQQIANGAPFDLYLSADLAYPRQLVGQGLAAADDVFRYAVGRLVLWVPEGSPVDPAPGLTVLTDPGVRTVAIANPEHAPYGRAAVAAMRSAGVDDDVAPKLVLGENVAQAAEFVRSGNAQAGVVAMSLVLADPLREEGRWVEVPLDSFPRLDQGGVVLAGSVDAEAARAVRDTLLNPEGTDVLRRYGFFLPGE